MAFDEVRINDNLVIYATDGGAAFSTDMSIQNNGYESRNQNWINSRGEWNLGDRTVAQTEADQLNAFFRARKGKARGFRLKDWLDYTDQLQGVGCGTFATVNATNTPGDIGVGTGLPTYQMHKVYASGGFSDYRIIQKPVAGKTVVRRNLSPVVIGSAAGQCIVDTTTGIVTFTADASSAASAITPGTTTQVTLAANPNSLVAGKKLFLNGFAGADAGLLNGLAHTINSVTGAGPYVFTLATNTNAKVITLGTGAGYAYPQASDALTWTGEFDVPVRFDTDKFMARFDGANVTSPGVIQGGYFYISRLPVIEVRQ